MAVKARRERSSAVEARSSGDTGEHQATDAHPHVQPWHAALLEAGWLAAAVVTPLLFSSYSPRAFASAKTVLIQSIAGFMLLAWLTHQVVRRVAAPPARAASPSPSRAAWLTSPLILAVLYLALVYVVTSLTSILPRLSLWGSYQRLEGAYTVVCNVVIFLLTASYLRRQEQAERLVTAVLLASWPVCLFGLAQQFGLDPIPWTGENREGIFSTLGHPLYLAAYLCMVVPLTLYRLGQGVANLRRAGGRSLAAGLLVVSLLVLLGLQLAALLLTLSRGPLLGLLAAVGVMFLVWAIARGQRKLILALVGVGLALGLVASVALFRAAPTPGGETPLAGSPLARVTRLMDSRGSGGFRLTLWNSAATLMGTNPVRLLLGYGPETFGSIVLPYYSPATVGSPAESLPERAHNITFDVLSTTGLLGLVAHVLLFGGVLLTGLGSLGLLSPPQARLAAVACLAVGSAVGALAPRLVFGGWGMSGLGLSLGLVGGVFLFLLLRVLLWPGAAPRAAASFPLAAVMLAAIVAHLVDISFGFRLPTTYLYFWLFAAVLVRREWEAADPAVATAGAGVGVARGGLLALALITLAYDFSDPYHLNEAQTAYVGPLLMALTFVLAGTVVLGARPGGAGPRKGVLDTPAAPWLVAAYLFGAYWLTRLPLEWLTADANVLLIHYVVWVALLVGVLVWGHAGGGPLRLPDVSRVQVAAYSLTALALIALVWGNLRPLRADVYATLGRLAAQGQTWDQSLAYFQRAISLAPDESYFYQQMSKAMLDRALATANPTEKETWFQRGAATLDQARALAPYSVDPVYNSAQYYVAWAKATPTQRQRLDRADTAIAYCDQTKRMIGTIGDIHLTCGLAQELRGNYGQALAEYQRALDLNRTVLQAYMQMGSLYRQQGDVQKAIGAYQTAVAIQPALIEARRRLVSLYLEQNDLTAALREAQAAVESRPSDFDVRRDLIGVYIKLGQMKDALREALAAQEVAPPDQRAALAKLIDELKAQQ